MKRIRTLALAVGLIAMTTSTTGCAGLTFPTAIADIRSAIDVANMVITAIQTFGGSYFNAHPNANDQAKFNTAVAQAQAAAAAALSVANGASDLKSSNVAAAFTDFENAYSSLIALGESLGIKISATAVKPGAEAQGDVLIVPSAAVLRPAMVAPRASVSLASPGSDEVPPAPAERPRVSSVAEQGAAAFGVSASRYDLREGKIPASRAAGAAPGDSSASPWFAASEPGSILTGDGWVRFRGGALFHCPSGPSAYDCALVSVAP